jgi:ubiquitin-like protein ATG12
VSSSRHHTLADWTTVEISEQVEGSGIGGASGIATQWGLCSTITQLPDSDVLYWVGSFQTASSSPITPPPDLIPLDARSLHSSPRVACSLERASSTVFATVEPLGQSSPQMSQQPPPAGAQDAIERVRTPPASRPPPPGSASATLQPTALPPLPAAPATPSAASDCNASTAAGASLSSGVSRLSIESRQPTIASPAAAAAEADRRSSLVDSSSAAAAAPGLEASLSLPSTASVPASAPPSSIRGIPAGLKVLVNFRATGSAPIMKKTKFTLSASHRFGMIIEWLRKTLHFKPQDGLFVFCNAAFAPNPDSSMYDLFQCYAIAGELVINYAIQDAWG